MRDSKKTLIACAQQFYDRGWTWGTAGNLSVRLNDDPLTIAITPSGLNKGSLSVDDLLAVEENKKNAHIRGHTPSAETAIHLAIYKNIPDAQAVFHVHAMHATVLSARHGHATERRMVKIDWIEMAKGIGAAEGEDLEVPVFANWQDVARVGQDFTAYVQERRAQNKKIPPVLLLHDHGMTAWGQTPDQARNHIESMEYISQYVYLKNLHAGV